MDALESLRDIVIKVNRKIRYPAIDELPPEARGVNFDPSGEGSASLFRVEKARIRRQFKVGQKVLFFIPRDGVFEEGTIIFERGLGKYQIKSSYDGRHHILEERNLRPG